jgi:hypothetical protein
MKKILLSICGLIGLSTSAYSQCATSSQPNGNCNYGYNINAFSLKNIPSTGNSGCSPGTYSLFPTPVRQLLQGQTYTWSATVGNGYYPMGFAIWIDLNSDNFFSASEMLASSPYAPTHVGSIFIPFSSTPGTNIRMRTRAASYTNIVGTDACTSYLGYFCETEDYLIDIIAPPPCSGTPSTSGVYSPTYAICPNASGNIGLTTTYTTSGNSYQWFYSTSSNVGPWQAVTNGTNATLATPNLTTSTYFTAVVTCANGGGTVMASASMVTVAAVTTNTAPYLETFEGIAYDNMLPNCSWSVTNMPSVSHTYSHTLNQNRSAHSGSKFASFYAYYVSGTNYFWTNKIYLYSGVTYSASVWYQTEYYGYTNVQEFAIQLGTTQSSVGLTTIASASPATSPVYKPLTNTFVVTSSGYYHVAISNKTTGSYGASYLSWDDLAIEIPCSLNQPNISLGVTPQATICQNETINFTASGADTYSWSTGATGPQMSDMPQYPTLYTVVATNTMTGCQRTVSQMVMVNALPNVIVVSNKFQICNGETAQLMVSGTASSYTWNTGAQTQNISVNPSASTSYTVRAENSAGCIAEASQMIVVLQNPLIGASSSASVQMCEGESQVLSGSGAGPNGTYSWAANTLFIVGQNAVISPTVTTTYTLTGTDANGCSNKITFTQVVDPCVGINEITTTLSGVKLYPNPNSGYFTVDLNNGLNNTVEVTDLTGRVIVSNSSKDDRININISTLVNGIYYVKIQSNNAVEVIKVVKH